MKDCVNETRLKFVWEFRGEPVVHTKRIQLSELGEMTLGEMLYRVLVGEGETTVKRAQGC